MSSEERNLHRNNAAEWLMWFAIAPIVYLLRFASLLRRFVVKKDGV